jgi:hypothetical protein
MMVHMQGFSPHSAVCCGAQVRRALEQPRRYITRPALANERVPCDAAGQVVLKLKTHWRYGTAHLVMSPLKFKPLRIELPLRGRQIGWSYVSCVSSLDSRAAGLTA